MPDEHAGPPAPPHVTATGSTVVTAKVLAGAPLAADRHVVIWPADTEFSAPATSTKPTMFMHCV